MQRVCCLAPKEACAHFQIGKVYIKLGKDKQALLHLNIAMDLNKDNKDYHIIKTHIEGLNLKNDEGSAEMDIDGDNKRYHTRDLHASPVSLLCR